MLEPTTTEYPMMLHSHSALVLIVTAFTCVCVCVLPVVQQSFHQPRDRGHEGDPRLSPRLLLDLLQQT